MQNHYNLLHREEQSEMMPSLKHFGVGSIPWSPLARGTLTHPVSTTTDTPAEKTLRHETDELTSDAYLTLSAGSKDIVNRVEKVAQKYDATLAQVSLAWLMAKEGVTAPIVRTTSLKRLEDPLGALDVKITPEDIAYMEEPYQPMRILCTIDRVVIVEFEFEPLILILNMCRNKKCWAKISPGHKQEGNLRFDACIS
ncbi:Aldo/keto reductase [Mycena venus]|uniref:Aldo/keto reductase n=1 Tax=Mycena venus TaxID=2733690 RepID=A0A8H6X6J4_9AGAR|nr:Aldo/keto reductase [Mycena venus]